MSITESDVELALNKFNEIYPRPGIQAMELSDRYYLDSDYPDNYWPHKREWGNGAGGIGVAGVYFFFDPSGALLYVGKAACIATRLSNYFRIGTDRKAVPTSDKSEGVSYIRTISFPQGHGFEASAVESYFVQELAPSRNERQ